VIAAVGNTPYNIFLVLHILTAMAAFAPAFVHPIVAGQTKAMAPDQRQTVLGYLAGNGRKFYGPALILTGIFGFGLSGMSDGVYALSRGWLIASIIVWVAMNGILHAVLLPAERAVASGDDSAEGRVSAGGGVLTILLVVMLYLMVFKPGQ
jgi:uncharacterized membrane protein